MTYGELTSSLLKLLQATFEMQEEGNLRDSQETLLEALNGYDPPQFPSAKAMKNNPDLQEEWVTEMLDKTLQGQWLRREATSLPEAEEMNELLENLPSWVESDWQ